ncbi:hybrid sensor histidine kinase/response regulator transcription factor [Aequorivita sublithincola]|uniref:hybrid sensor histidine kinase/response regulator transcription factor n=1 Tax=Aequorivita sublithincola TaxID=101385 RepID=UPI0012F78C20|nr:response regulator [Aequorivita sublithincola]
MKRALFLLQLLLLGISATSQSYDRGLKLLAKADNFNKEKVWDSAYTSAKESLTIFKNLQNDSLVAKAALELFYTTNNINYGEQSQYFDLALQNALKVQKPTLLAAVYYMKGRTHFENRDMGEAQPYFLKVDSLANQYDFLNETIVKAVMARSEISRITFTHDGVEIGHDLQLQALELAKKINSEELINDLYLRLSDMNGLIENYPEAKRYVDLAFNYYIKEDNVERMARVYLTYMNYYYAVDDYDNAGKKLEEGIEYLSNKNNPEQLASMLTAYGTYFRKRRNDCSKALIQFEKAKTIYDEIDLKLSDRYMYLMEGMALCFAETNNFEKAYIFYQKAYETKRDLVKKENNDLTRELETKYQSEKKEQQIALLASQKLLIEQQNKNDRLIFLGSILLFGIVSLFIFFQYRTRQKTNGKLKELDKAKSTFFANISHEFRTPLSLINGPIEDQLSSKKLSPNERKNLNMALRSAQRLEDLVDQLLALSKLESKNLNLQVQNTNLPQFLVAQAEAFSFSCSEKNISYTIHIEKDEVVDWFDRDVLEKIFYNLIGNAIKYTPEQGTITIEGSRSNNQYEITIENSGNFIKAEEREKIFERFYKSTTLSPGAGIGLALTKELTELHHGTILVNSEKGGLTTFTVQIPINKNAFESNEIFCAAISKTEEFSPTQEIVNLEKSIVIPEDAPILLIVDDNEDIRDYVSSIFETIYIVLSAKDGKEGFEKALEHIPDIVISDVMMPVEDGFELTKHLKENQLTSHIPVVLLTAKNQVTAKLEGMGIGADAYVTKPFNPQLLRANVDNLIENRRKLQQRFAQEVILAPKDIAVSSEDEKFLERLQKVLDEYLTNPDFSAETFAAEMAVSRMQLHRKLKALTGQTTTEFIRSQRLRLASKLLKVDKISISEVGYAVGFNDPSYFTKCFKQEFGSSPSEYLSK